MAGENTTGAAGATTTTTTGEGATGAASSTTETLLTGTTGGSTTPGTTTTDKQGETAAAATGTATAGTTTEGGEKPAAGAEADKKTSDTDGKGEEGKEAAAGAAAEELAITLPDGVEADEQLLADFKAEAKALGLKGEQAQKFADVYVKASLAAAEKAEQAFTARQQEWVQTVKQDKDIGGPQLQANLAKANAALGKYGSPGLVQLLQQTGLSNHPDMVRFAVAVGRAMSDDSVTGTHGTGNTGKQSEDDILRARYPSMYRNS